MLTIGRVIDHYFVVGSTNDIARGWALRGEPEGIVVTADEQTAGRGRLGRRWLAPPGSSIQLSVLLRPALPASRGFALTQLAALALAATLRTALGLQPALKWPNDVLLNSRKCAGILIETALQGGEIDYAIVGMGLNVNFSMSAFPDLTPYATTLQDELGHEVDRERLEEALILNLDDHYKRLREGVEFFEEWRSALTGLGERARVLTPEGIVEGTAENVEPDGALVMNTGDRRVRLYSGDVTIIKE